MADGGISTEQIRNMFELFDADKSGTIDRSELRVLCFALGKPLNDEQLESALAEMDSDGNGTIEFDELKEFIQSEGQQDGESISGMLQFALRRKLLAARAKDVINRLGFSAGDAPSGTVDISTVINVGDTFAASEGAGGAPGGAAAGAGEGKEGGAVEAPFEIHLSVGPAATSVTPSDLGANGEEHGALQLVVGLAPGTKAEDVAAFSSTLEAVVAKMTALFEEMEEPLPLSRLTVTGPMPSPVAGSTGDVLVISAYTTMNLEEEVGGELTEALTSLPIPGGVVASSDSDEEAAQGDEDYEGRKVKGAALADAMKRLLARFNVHVRSNRPLKELLGQVGSPEGGAADSQLELDALLSKAILHLLRRVVTYGMYKSAGRWSDGRKEGNPLMQALGVAMGCNKFRSVSHFTSEQSLVLTALAGLRDDRPDAEDMTAVRMLSFLTRGIMFMLALDKQDLDESDPTPLDQCAQLFTSGDDSLTKAAGGHVTDPGADAQAELAAAEGEAAAMAMVTTGLGLVRWAGKHLTDLQQLRVSGLGLGLTLAFKGMELAPLGEQMAVVSATKAALIKQAEAKLPIPGVLLLAPNPWLAAAVRGAAFEDLESGQISLQDFHLGNGDVKNFRPAAQLTLARDGAIDYTEPFEWDMEETSSDVRQAWGADPHGDWVEQYMGVLGQPKVVPPSGVAGPFAIALVLPGQVLPSSVLTSGTSADAAAAAAHPDVAVLKRFLAKAQDAAGEVATASGVACPPAITVIVDVVGGHAVGGADICAAAMAALGLTEGQAVLADFATSLGVMEGLAAAVQGITGDMGEAYIKRRAEETLSYLPESAAAAARVHAERPRRLSAGSAGSMSSAASSM